ncbi:MAG: hypothetical protein WD844_11195 [Thermoleophilaceae bacterium]
MAALACAPAAGAGTCGGLLQPKCPPPPPPAPDPGGIESPDQPVPAPGKQFGFNSQLYRGGAATVDQELGAAQDAGATVHRMPVQWSTMQPNPADPPVPEGQATDEIDIFYAEALARGITPILIPFAAPGWATKYRSCGLLDFTCRHMATTGGLALIPDWPFIDEYETFVHAVKARWPRAIIESWNSPNHYYKHPTYRGSLDFTAAPGHFARIQCAAYRASKRVNDDPVLAAGWASRLYVEYVRGVYAAGGADCWDRANLHAYPGESTSFGAGTNIARVFRDARMLRSQYGDEDPIWITETGYSTSGPYAVNEATQADGARRLYNRYATMPDVEAVIFHTLRDAATEHYTSQEHPEYGFGFLRTNWWPKPVYCHFAGMAGSAYPGC